MSNKVIAIAGSPSKSSRSTAALEYIIGLLKETGFETELFTVLDVAPEDLVSGNFESQSIQNFIMLVERANGIIIATPVYKASYSGVLKALLDLLPQTAFSGKVILPIATGGTIAHLLAIDYAMKPLFSTLGACHILRGLYIVDTQAVRTETGSFQFDSEVEQRLQVSLQELIKTLS